MPTIGLISDTHGVVYPAVHELLRGVELILHAGDVGDETVLIELEAIAPVRAVIGNTDWSPLTQRLPTRLTVALPFGTVGMTHGHLAPGASDWPRRLPEMFGDVGDLRVIVYGHSHIPKFESVDGVLVVNPGAAGRPRFRSRPTLAVLRYEADGGGPTIEHREIPMA